MTINTHLVFLQGAAAQPPPPVVHRQPHARVDVTDAVGRTQPDLAARRAVRGTTNPHTNWAHVCLCFASLSSSTLSPTSRSPLSASSTLSFSFFSLSLYPNLSLSLSLSLPTSLYPNLSLSPLFFILLSPILSLSLSLFPSSISHYHNFCLSVYLPGLFSLVKCQQFLCHAADPQRGRSSRSYTSLVG